MRLDNLIENKNPEWMDILRPLLYEIVSSTSAIMRKFSTMRGHKSTLVIGKPRMMRGDHGLRQGIDERPGRYMIKVRIEDFGFAVSVESVAGIGTMHDYPPMDTKIKRQYAPTDEGLAQLEEDVRHYIKVYIER